MSSKIILIESRIEEFEKNFAKKFSQEQKEKIINEIPSKFWSWAGKELDQISFDQSFELVKSLLDYFNKFGSNLVKSDIFQYKNINELKDELDKYANRQRRNFKKLHGANVVYESPKYLVVNPLSFESSCYYGSGTKWCTAGRNSSETFNRYNSDGKLFYILDKTLPTSDPNYKVGLSRKYDGDESYYDSQDNPLRNPAFSQTKEFQSIINKIRDYMSTEYSENIKSVEEEKRKKDEEARQRRLEIERIRRGKLAQGEERRVEQEWALTPDIDDEGKMAWAVLEQLESEGGTIRDREQEERLQEIQIQINNLNAQYDEDPEVRTDLLDQIEELEEEKDEILEMLDVYYINPLNYDYYGLTKFEVIHPDFEGQTFAVGTESEVEDAAKEYVEQLIDDIGITGFNESFWKNYLDEDAIVDHARSFFEDDIYDNPEAYLDDEDRMLDSKQIDKIKILKDRIASTELIISNLQDLLDEQEDEDKIEELQTRIEDLEEKVTEFEEEIESIEENPEGDWPQDLIDEKVQDRLSDVERNPERYLDEWGLNAEDFVDRDEFIQGVVDEDGYGQLSPYDGSYNVFNIMGEDYYVFRID
jgi:hypothetical protein